MIGIHIRLNDHRHFIFQNVLFHMEAHTGQANFSAAIDDSIICRDCQNKAIFSKFESVRAKGFSIVASGFSTNTVVTIKKISRMKIQSIIGERLISAVSPSLA